MYLSRFDLLYLSLARAGGLPLHPETTPRELNAELALHQESVARLHAQERERWRRTRRDRRARRLRLLRQALGRALSEGGRRLAEAGQRLSGSEGPQLKGCG